MKAYSVVLAVLISVEVFLLVTRSDYDATIIRAKGMLYQAQPNDQVSNLFTIKLVNKTRKTLPVEIKIEGVPGSKIEMVGRNLEVKGEGITQGSFFIFLNRVDIKKRKTELKIGIYSNGKLIKIVKTSFLGPVKA